MTAAARTPRVETMLAAAHRDRQRLLERRDALVLRGIGRDHLPDDAALLAFAFLGDHGRDELLGLLAAAWPDLQLKGLAHGALAAATTPELRLLAAVREPAEAIGPVWRQLREAVDAPRPPPEILVFPPVVRGFWGQRTRLQFSFQGVTHLLIEPDRVFGLQPALLALNGEGRQGGELPLEVDSGDLTLTLLHRSGQVYRARIRIGVLEDAA